MVSNKMGDLRQEATQGYGTLQGFVLPVDC